MARRRSTSRRLNRPKRRYEWARFEVAQQFDLASGAVVNPWTNMLSDYEDVLGADAAGTTVTRIRGSLSAIWQSGTTAISDVWRLNYGIIVQTDPPSELTSAQLEEQIGQHYADWMLYDQKIIYPASTSFIEERALRWDLDLKSQRRFDELQQSLYMLSGVTGVANAGTIHFNGFLNVLLKQP